MSQNQSKLPSVAELLEMSRTQIVAEAFLLDEDQKSEYLHPSKEKNEYTFKNVALDPKILKDGNNHTSKLTEPQITEFMENWKVVAGYNKDIDGIDFTYLDPIVSWVTGG